MGYLHFTLVVTDEIDRLCTTHLLFFPVGSPLVIKQSEFVWFMIVPRPVPGLTDEH